MPKDVAHLNILARRHTFITLSLEITSKVIYCMNLIEERSVVVQRKFGGFLVWVFGLFFLI